MRSCSQKHTTISFAALGALVLALVWSTAANAQTGVPSPHQRIEELEERINDLEKQLDKLEDKEKKGGGFSEGILTVGEGVEFRLGGKAELLFIDSENEGDPIVGPTDEPDPRFEINRLRLEPRLKLNRHFSTRAQIDLKPTGQNFTLKEITVRHRADPAWWFESDFRLGLDDRFIRPNRRTKTYPLIGNAFWRDESVAAVWALKFGRAQGPPKPKVEGAKKKKTKKKKKSGKKSKKKSKKSSKDGRQDDLSSPDAGATELDLGLGDELPLDDDSIMREAGTEGRDLEVSSDSYREEFRESYGAFDFGANAGELTLFLSVGTGNSLDNNEIGFDRAALNDIIQDDRNLDDDISVSELGAGLRYRREFASLGEFSLLGFFYHDRLDDTSLSFLQNDLTLRDNVGVALAGYGDSTSRKSIRYGVGAEYFLPARTLFGSAIKTRNRDGLRVQGQWIRGDDGQLEREGWYVQSSYRFSVGRLIADRYLRSFEPLVRYGELDTSLAPLATLPATWERERLVVGMITEVTGEILLKAEYMFNFEDTGGGVGPRDVDNDELMVELLILF